MIMAPATGRRSPASTWACTPPGFLRSGSEKGGGRRVASGEGPDGSPDPEALLGGRRRKHRTRSWASGRKDTARAPLEADLASGRYRRRDRALRAGALRRGPPPVPRSRPCASSSRASSLSALPDASGLSGEIVGVGSPLRRARHQDRHADPLREPARGRRRPHRQRGRRATSATSGPCIVVDFGTATTFDVVTREGRISRRRDRARGSRSRRRRSSSARRGCRASRSGAPSAWSARRPRRRSSPGLYFGYLGLVDGMIDRIVAEIGGTPRGDRDRRPRGSPRKGLGADRHGGPASDPGRTSDPR